MDAISICSPLRAVQPALLPSSNAARNGASRTAISEAAAESHQPCRVRLAPITERSLQCRVMVTEGADARLGAAGAPGAAGRGGSVRRAGATVSEHGGRLRLFDPARRRSGGGRL